MVLPIFPQDHTWPIQCEVQFRTAISTFEQGAEQRRKLWNVPKRSYKLPFAALNETDFWALRDFYIARSGPTDLFYLKDLTGCTVSSEAVGTGNSVLTQFTLDEYPIADSETITLAGVTQSTPGDYSIDIDSKTITFTSPPGVVAIVATYEYYRRVRFVEDIFQFNSIVWQIFSTELSFIEVR